MTDAPSPQYSSGTIDLGPHNRAFHAALRKYPDAFEALHYFWNEAFAGAAQPSAGIQEPDRTSVLARLANSLTEWQGRHQYDVDTAAEIILGDLERAQRQPAPPLELHWLGDRDSADATRHAIDMRGCVMYFEQQSDCLQFMRWVTALPMSSTDRGDGA